MGYLMTRGVRVFISIAALTTAVHAGAEWGNGNNLLAECQLDLKNGPPSTCKGYITGVMDSHPDQGGPYCIPIAGLNLGQVRDVVKKWLIENPELRSSIKGATAVNAALKEAWPIPMMWWPKGTEGEARPDPVPVKDKRPGEWVGVCPRAGYAGSNRFTETDYLKYLYFELPDNYEMKSTWLLEYFK